MTNTQEKHVTRLAQTKGYTLEKVGKGPHHGRFSLISKAAASGRVLACSNSKRGKVVCTEASPGDAVHCPECFDADLSF